MTVKQAIKERCRDCAETKCSDTRCVLYGLMKPKRGADRNGAIRKYCAWCMNGHSVRLCSSRDCGIYQYRAAVQGVLFFPLNSGKKSPSMQSGETPDMKMVHPVGTGN